MAKEKFKKGKIVVFGILFWYPLAGVTYQFLNYLIGLRNLGYDVYYVEDSSRWLYDPKTDILTPKVTENLQEIVPILDAYGFHERWVFRDYLSGECYGMTSSQLLQLYQDADACLNVTGDQDIKDEQLTCRRHVYIESDPVISQFKLADGDVKMIKHLAHHDTFFSFGENLGNADCGVPVGQYEWKPTRQPVVLSLWQHSYGAGETYNTIATWNNKGKDITYRGETYYWRKARELEKFLDLPHKSPLKFEIAANVSKDEKITVKELLNQHGWQQSDAVKLSQDIQRYQTYIQTSRGEFTVAKDQYTRLRTGWFSDRSACYLAAGRPVITQETGFSKFLPTGKGLFSFQTMEDILVALDEIESDYEGNCRAAREIAAEYFAAEKVLGSLMERAEL
ncbi:MULTISPECIES: hypothetical protein [Cyanophyceae]|uniref:hypothetical protein n=1 Tax=Cyanophyceae TaxID=3028117 RepID=UPI001684BEB1|nr:MULTISPECIES: hypothetical protein [Cyanophyceae]MBD1918052.1 hypothetical protein [Phormidium sp. FACHB-77]MBD2030085.1 hypothetical protein [Phormidium sp. FACHB-322]MBD2051544.1 hypothetical protein [Leptolyngbya sp. FACHB-60]